MKNLVLVPLVLACILMIAACPNVPKQTNNTCPPFPHGHGNYCAQGNTAADSFLCPYLPRDVDVQTPSGYNGFIFECQQAFDWFSWQTFIALNWPANPNGTPYGSNINDGANLPRIWETYQDPDELFSGKLRLAGALPVLSSRSKAGFGHFDSIPVDHGSFFEAFSSPLIDRNLNFTLYEIRVNPVEARYITSNQLNTYAGQSKFAGPVNFPSGSYPNDTGSMEIKVAWKILVPGVDDFDKFYHRQAVVHVDRSEVMGGKADINDTVTVGMVGMHIIRKVGDNGKFWIWSSFEHVDNAPNTPNATRPYSYYNPDCKNCPPNGAPIDSTNQFLWSPSNGANPQYARAWATDGKYGTQVYRVVPVDSSATYTTRTWQAKLQREKAVWQNYKLIGSQWGLITETYPSRLIGVPTLEANTVAETYFQKDASCIGCHSSATTSTSAKDSAISADFSFLLGIPRKK